MDTSNDRKVDRDEFEGAIPLLASWGLALQADLHAEFLAVDADGGGKLLFDEFAGWAIQKSLDLDPSDTVFGEETLKSNHMSSTAVASQAKHASRKKTQASVGGQHAVHRGQADIMHNMNAQSLVAQLPVRDDGPDVEKRARLFSACDSSNNGTLTVSEVKMGLNMLMGREAVRAFSVAIMSAFRAAKDLDGLSAEGAAERVSIAEFHALIVYLRYYLELLVCFHQIDVSDDQEVDIAEFIKAAPLLRSWGVEVDDPTQQFREMNTDGGGHVLFHEFAGWALRSGLDIWHGRSVYGVQTRLPAIQKAELAKKHAALGEARSISRRPRRRLTTISPTGLESLNLRSDVSALIHTLPTGT